MKTVLFSVAASAILLLFATPGRAQSYDPYDPCFDASASKSQYEACAVDMGGYSGSGGTPQTCTKASCWYCMPKPNSFAGSECCETIVAAETTMRCDCGTDKYTGACQLKGGTCTISR